MLFKKLTSYRLLLSIAVILLVGRLLSEQYGFHLSTHQALKEAALWVFIASSACLLFFFLIVLFSPNKTERWWEVSNSPSQQRSDAQLLRLYIYSLAAASLIVIYGLMLIAVLQSWKFIAMFGATILIGRIITYFKARLII